MSQGQARATVKIWSSLRALPSGCFDRISLTLREYEHVSAEGTRFFVVPGHQNLEVELVVETQSGYVIVEKDGPAGVVADLADPRDGE